MDQHRAVVHDLLAAGNGGQDFEILSAGGDVDVRPTAGSQRADAGFHLESAGGIDGDELDALQEAQALTKGGAQSVIQMAAILQIAGVQVVGDDGHIGRVHTAVHNSLQQTQRHVAGRRALAHLQMDAVAQTLVNILFAERFVAGVDTGGSAGGHIGAIDAGQMALQGLAGHGQGVAHGLQQLLVLGNDVVSNAFAQANCILALQGLADDLGIKFAAGGLQIRGEGNMGRNDEVDRQIGVLRFLQDGLDAFQSGNDADLMQVGHDAGGTVLQNAFCKGTDGQTGAFGMDVTVQETGRDVVSLCVDHLGVFADAVRYIAHSRDGITADSNTAIIDLAGVDIDDLTVVDHQVGGL